MTRIPVSELRNVDWPGVLRFLTGEEVPADIEREAVAAITADMERWERRQAETAVERRRLNERARELLGERRLSQEQAAEAAKIVREARLRWPGFEPFEPTLEKEEPTIKIGSVEATIVPPYDFATKHDDVKTGPAKVTATANKSTGFLSCDVQAPPPDVYENNVFWDPSSGVAFAAVGINFQPFYNGRVRFGAQPPLIYFGTTPGVGINDLQSSGQVKLLVYRFKSDGTLDPPPQTLPIQHDYWAMAEKELWYLDSNNGQAEDATTPWMTVEFDVSTNRHYHMWVAFRVNASSDGAGWLGACIARAEMNGTVPKMKWKFLT